MSSRVQQQQQSSAFKSGATRRGSLDRRRHSLRQKKVLARDDSGIFSLSPSPLTPSRGTFPAPPVAEAEPEPGAMSNFDLDVDEGPPGRVHEPVRRAGSQPNFVDGRVMQTPQDDYLYLAFSCRSSCGPERWTYCGHTYCTNIRNQWQHRSTCSKNGTTTEKPCDTCQEFQQLIFHHVTQCHDNSCIVTLCSDAKRNLRQFNPDKIGAVPFRNGHSHRPLLLHSTSFQESEEPSKRSQFVSSRNHGSFDDALLSPQSPADYLKSLQELDEIGVGALPRHLRTSYKRKLKVEQIIRDMGLEDSIDELPPVENLPPAPPVPPVQSSSKYPVPPPGVLSPIEEHPTLSEEDDYPSQIILHKMQSEVLTQGRDGRYLHRRDYDLNEHLGSGGFGTCAAARDHKTDKLFVIKSNKFNDDKMINTLKSECDILARIPEHENITRFLGAILEEQKMSQDRSCRLMMELAEHGSLSSMLVDVEGGADALPLDQSLYYLQQILQGLYHLHSCSIVHLDIKAENVLVLEGGRRVKLTDFGTAAHIDDIAGSLSKLAGHTAHFTAPEIIRGEVPSFSCDIWSTGCVLIQLTTARLPGCCTCNKTRENMLFTVGNYTDKAIEQLIPLSEISGMADQKDVCDIFYDTLREDPRSRPSALQLLGYPALVNACEYEQYFDVECAQLSEQEVEIQSGAGSSMEGAESSYYTPPTSLPHLITSAGNDSDVSLDFPVHLKRASQDSGVSTKYDRALSEVFSVLDINDDSGVDTPGTENYAYRQLNVQGLKMAEGVIAEDREGEERFTSIPDRSVSHPEASLDYSDSNPYRRRSMSATYQRPAPEGVGPQFGRAYPDANEMFFSLPNKTTTIVSTLSQKVRPNFVHLIHSNSAPVVMTDNGEGGRGRDHTAGKPSENEVPKRLRRSSSEVYVDRGPDIDTPEEKKKKQELALAKQAEEQEQMVAMAAGPVDKGTNQPSSASVSIPNHTPPLQRGHSSSFSGHEHPAPSSVPYQPPMYVGRQAGPNAVGNHPCHVQRHGRNVGFTRETLV